MSALDESLKSVIAGIQPSDQTILITAWKPDNMMQFIGLLQRNGHESMTDSNAGFCATRVDHPNSQNQVIIVSISDYEQAQESFPAFQGMQNKVVFSLLTTIEDFTSNYSAFRNWFAFAIPDNFSASIIFIPSEVERGGVPGGFGSCVSWVELGWGLYILQSMEPEEAWGIVDAEITRSLGGFHSQLQEEMMVLRFWLYETNEGAALSESLRKLLREQKSVLKEIRDSLETTGNPSAKEELMEELKAAYILYRDEFRDLLDKIVSLGVIPGKATIQFFQEGIMGS